MFSRLFFIAAALALFFSSCEYKNEDDDFPSGCDTTHLHYAVIKPIVTAYCLPCHNDPPTIAPFKLNTYNDLVNAVETKSLKDAITHTGIVIPMPYNPSDPALGNSLDSCSLKKMVHWIDLGAPQ